MKEIIFTTILQPKVLERRKYNSLRNALYFEEIISSRDRNVLTLAKMAINLIKSDNGDGSVEVL